MKHLINRGKRVESEKFSKENLMEVKIVNSGLHRRKSNREYGGLNRLNLDGRIFGEKNTGNKRIKNDSRESEIIKR